MDGETMFAIGLIFFAGLWLFTIFVVQGLMDRLDKIIAKLDGKR